MTRWSSGIVLGLRALMELGVVIGLGSFGYATGGARATKLALAIVMPAVGFGIWGLVDFRRAGRLAEPLRLAEELLLSGLAAVAWYAAGARLLGWGLGALSIIEHVLVYACGGTLLGRHARDASSQRHGG